MRSATGQINPIEIDGHYRQMAESEKLDAEIRKNLEVLGYGE